MRIDSAVNVNVMTVARHKAAPAMVGNVAVDDVQLNDDAKQCQEYRKDENAVFIALQLVIGTVIFKRFIGNRMRRIEGVFGIFDLHDLIATAVKFARPRAVRADRLGIDRGDIA